MNNHEIFYFWFNEYDFLTWLVDNQGSKCEEWKDEKKGSATVLYTQIINSQLVYTVHGTHFAEGSAAP